MDKVEEQLMQLGSNARSAIAELTLLQKQYMKQGLPYDMLKESATPLIKEYNLYAKALAKARKMPYKPISLGYFLR